MPTRLQTPCRAPGCIELSDRGYCTEHMANREKEYEQRRGSAASRGYNGDWRKARLMFIKRNPLCVHCLAIGVYREATDVDHIRPHKGSRDLFWDVGNWQSLCKSCHSTKTSKEDGRWGAY